MKLNLEYSNNTVCISVELFDDGTKYEQEYNIFISTLLQTSWQTYTAVRICMRKR